jgi:hypothetical protein
MTPPNPESGAWLEYRRLVLAELQRLDTVVTNSETKLLSELKELRKELAEANSTLTTLQAKAGLLGFIAGLAASLGAAFLGR